MHRNYCVVRALAVGLVVVAATLFSACVPRDQALANEGFREIEKTNYSMAELRLKQALEINDKNAYAMLNLGAVYQRTGRTEEARALFEKVIAMSPNEAPRQATKGSEHLTLKQLAEKDLAMLPAKK